MSARLEETPRHMTTLLACCEPYFVYLAELRSGELAIDSPDILSNILSGLNAEFGGLRKRFVAPEAGAARRELWDRVAIALAVTADQVVLTLVRARAVEHRHYRLEQTLEWTHFRQSKGAADFLTLCRDICLEESNAAVEIAGVLYRALLLGFHWAYRERPQELLEWRMRLFQKAGFDDVTKTSQILPPELETPQAKLIGDLPCSISQRGAAWAEALWGCVGLGLSENRAPSSTWRGEMLRRGIALERQSVQLVIGFPQVGEETVIEQISAELHPPLNAGYPEPANASTYRFWYSSRAAFFVPRDELLQSASHGGYAEAWRAFLSELAGYRPGHSLDGVVLVTPSHVLRSDVDFEQHARRAGAIRTALLEVAEVVGQDLPITWVITKGDLLPGFTDCAQSLNVERRGQCLGWSAEFDWGSSFHEADCARGIEDLATSASDLRDAVALHLENADDLAWIDRVYLLPQRVRELAAAMLSAWRGLGFSTEGGSRFLLRGIYLTGCSPADSAKPWFSKELWDRRILSERSLARKSKRAEVAELARERHCRDIQHWRRLVRRISVAMLLLVALAIAVWRPRVAVRITNSIGMQLLWCPPGEFQMGSEGGVTRYPANEVLHSVVLTQGFYLAETEVTQGQWSDIMGTEDGTKRWKGKDKAIAGDEVAASYVSWKEAVEFCRLLTEREKESLFDGWVYRLPTEAEWEYACRSGSTSRFSFGDGDAELRRVAVFRDARRGEFAHAVRGDRSPNSWGLFDLHGNVWEWTLDRCSLEGGLVATATYRDRCEDPRNEDGAQQVIRGGSWKSYPDACRSASRYAHFPDQPGTSDIGFRVLLGKPVGPTASSR